MELDKLLFEHFTTDDARRLVVAKKNGKPTAAYVSLSAFIRNYSQMKKDLLRTKQNDRFLILDAIYIQSVMHQYTQGHLNVFLGIKTSCDS